MSKLIKRKDGSYSKRGLWDNIRANKGSGKEPTKEMLKQESKIKKEENMKSMYKSGGKTSKKKVMKEARKEGESFMEESKEIGFGAPGVKPPKRQFDLGGLMDKDKPKEQPTAPQPTLGSQLPAGVKALPVPPPEPKLTPRINLNREERGPGSVLSKKKGGMVETGMDVVARGNRAEGEATMAGKKKMGGKKMMYKKGGFPDLNKDGKVTQADILKGRGIDMKKSGGAKKYNAGGITDPAIAGIGLASSAFNKKAMPSEFDNELANSAVDISQNKMMAKKGGAKSMKPGGGGRFAKMVSGLKKEGKSEDSAKAIAASIGRKKYGNSRFQAMAAAGKKKMGGKMC